MKKILIKNIIGIVFMLVSGLCFQISALATSMNCLFFIVLGGTEFLLSRRKKELDQKPLLEEYQGVENPLVVDVFRSEEGAMEFDLNEETFQQWKKDGVIYAKNEQGDLSPLFFNNFNLKE